MSIDSSLPTYTDIANALKISSKNDNASAVHGLMCGLIVASSGLNDTRWKNLLGFKENAVSENVLSALYEISYHHMSEFSFEFNLVLPDDSHPIEYRAEALGLWCQGFLTGLKQSNVQLTHRPPGEITDTINDIIEISKVDYDEITNDNEDETAYFELVEYVRLAVLMLFQELKNDATSLN